MPYHIDYNHVAIPNVSVLTMLQSRLHYVQITRDYAEDLPSISAYGSELNQVWTALLENALDAIHDHGEIQLKVALSGELMLIEVWDNDRSVYDAMSVFVEATDWVTWQLTGQLMRASSAAGYKACWSPTIGAIDTIGRPSPSVDAWSARAGLHARSRAMSIRVGWSRAWPETIRGA